MASIFQFLPFMILWAVTSLLWSVVKWLGPLTPLLMGWLYWKRRPEQGYPLRAAVSIAGIEAVLTGLAPIYFPWVGSSVTG
ncbi:MAG: hypothetical protein F6K19_44775 [Cyanothece sp. SIO1E1]|nr:hypothetical protein [Cyanothece sp. SIO1E1]